MGLFESISRLFGGDRPAREREAERPQLERAVAIIKVIDDAERDRREQEALEAARKRQAELEEKERLERGRLMIIEQVQNGWLPPAIIPDIALPKGELCYRQMGAFTIERGRIENHTCYVTNRRMILRGAARTKSFRYSSLLSVRSTAEAQITLERSVGAHVPLFIEGDPTIWAAIISELLSRASAQPGD